MQKTDNIYKLIAPYIGENLWLALTSDKTKIVGKGETLVKALEEAQRKKVKNPSVIKAMSHPAHFIGADRNGI